MEKDNMESIINEVKCYLLENIIMSVSDIDENMPLIESGLIDSISIVKVLIFLENNFCFELTEEDLNPNNYETLKNICTLVYKKVYQ